MKHKFRIKLTGEGRSATHVLEYASEEKAERVRESGDVGSFRDPEGGPVSFAGVRLGDLPRVVEETARECGADHTFEDLTGKREFQIKLSGDDFNAEYLVNYIGDDPIPSVTAPPGGHLQALPDGTNISFDKVNATELQSFVASMAESNGLNFEFVDLHD
ncbi:hypothetical protein JIN84_00530 [Luteolibacter yonseiensis]|uniref:Uncharacterized protein n=1 Tax=Luteolibacter yonseiensis TaxID=1144680 RepID=A0A934QZU9_9BACT|nr:hypothetical protein [Luteolibacter yonseiensis]MBK1814092.1 hypothetical protein [Luteolibacter yonseiensis]